MNRCLLLVALALLWSSDMLRAEEKDASESHQAKLESQFDELDKDGDGQLSEEEAREFSQKRLGRMREQGLRRGYPLPRDEFLTAGVAEREADDKKDQNKAEERPSRKDGRNAVRSDEREAPSGAGSPPSSPTSGGRRISSGKSKFVRNLPAEYQAQDKNGDGQIGLYEWDRAKYAEFAKLDKNGDGFLTPAELAAKIVAKPGDARPGGNAGRQPRPDRKGGPRHLLSDGRQSRRRDRGRRVGQEPTHPPDVRAGGHQPVTADRRRDVCDQLPQSA